MFSVRGTAPITEREPVPCVMGPSCRTSSSPTRTALISGAVLSVVCRGLSSRRRFRLVLSSGAGKSGLLIPVVITSTHALTLSSQIQTCWLEQRSDFFLMLFWNGTPKHLPMEMNINILIQKTKCHHFREALTAHPILLKPWSGLLLSPRPVLSILTPTPMALQDHCYHLHVRSAPGCPCPAHAVGMGTPCFLFFAVLSILLGVRSRAQEMICVYLLDKEGTETEREEK